MFGIACGPYIDSRWFEGPEWEALIADRQAAINGTKGFITGDWSVEYQALPEPPEDGDVRRDVFQRAAMCNWST